MLAPGQGQRTVCFLLRGLARVKFRNLRAFMPQAEMSFPKETLIPEVITDLVCIGLEGVMRVGLNHVFDYISARYIKDVLSKDITVA